MHPTASDDYYIKLGSKAAKEKITSSSRGSRMDVIEQIAVGLAHGIRNPLTVIKGYVQFCQSKPSCCTGDAFELIMEEVKCIEELVSSLISLARNKAIEKTPQNLNQIITKLFPVIQAEAIRHGVIVELFLSDALPTLNASGDEMRQLIMQLARNGVEAMPGSGKLIIGTGSEAGKVVLYIQDEGGGISLENIDKIFDPFYTTKDGNSGLGLAIGLSIVERHQGHIQIASNIGGGTTVRVAFPVLEEYKGFLHVK